MVKQSGFDTDLIRLLYTLDSILKFYLFHLVRYCFIRAISICRFGDLATSWNSFGTDWELIWNLPKTYLEHIRNPFGTSICFYLSQHITTHSIILRHIWTTLNIRTHSDIFGHLGTSWNILERLGTSWNVLERLRTSWNILELV